MPDGVRTLAAAAALLACVVAMGADVPEAKAREQCPGAAIFLDAEDATAHRVQQPPVIATAPALRAELRTMFDADQAARLALMPAPTEATSQRVMEVDARNLARIKAIVAEYRFPTAQLVGVDGVRNAWLLVQHADADPGFQEEVLRQIDTSNGATTPEEIALLTDRVLRAHGKPQLYGSQFEASGGQWVAQPTRDLQSLDARRSAMHLMPMADYSCFINALYAPPAP